MLFWLCAAFIAIYLLIERGVLHKSRQAVPLRIHVYGTRGKTGLTRMVIELLRRNGIRTMGRTTGDEPVLHEPDGAELKQRRLGPANVHEYTGCLKRAADSGCQALVMECMALSPENVHTAGKILQPGRVLLTNTRPDHYESQGPGDEDIVRTLALSMTPGSRVCALADAGAAILEQRATDKGLSLVLLEAGNEPAPARENARLANCLAEELGLAPLEIPAPVWPEFRRIQSEGCGQFLFLDLFSANDVVSVGLLLEQARQRLTGQHRHLPLVALLATRSDRPLRTRAFTDWLVSERPVALCCPTGSHALYAGRRLHSGGLEVPGGIHFASRPEKLLRALEQAVGLENGGNGEFLLVGLGNAHGYGERFRNFIAGCAE